MLAQLAQRGHRRPAPPIGQFLRQDLNRAVHANGEHLFHIGQVGIKRAVLDIGAKAANRRLDRCAVLGMRPHQSRQA